jgi:hypothetical protein
MNVTPSLFFRVSCHFLAEIARLAWGAGATGPIRRARVLRAPGCGAPSGRSGDQVQDDQGEDDRG